jgi:EAL domain-containing protein (putative c-di-GMP-specific phosphodiesterase class I)
LIEVFRLFDKHPHHVDLAVEIVESEDLAIEAAQRSIEALARAGIRTYLDDFGTGYSSIHHLAALSLEGVKLDRAFAMATDGTLMAQMLPHALEMMQRTKRLTVVEGVETEERLKALRATSLVDFVQGYFIARPLDIERFAQFLVQNDRTSQPAKYSAAG